MDKIMLKLSQQEVAVLLLLVKLGMDFYTGNPAGDALEALRSVPNRVIDGVIAKASRAGTAALKGSDGNGRTLSH